MSVSGLSGQKVFVLTDETPHDGPGLSCSGVWSSPDAAKAYLRDVVLGDEYYDLLVWYQSPHNPDYWEATARWPEDATRRRGLSERQRRFIEDESRFLVTSFRIDEGD